MPNAEETLLASLVRLMSHWTSASTQGDIARGAGVEVDAGDVQALYTLGLTGPIRPGRLAHELRISPPTLTKLVTRLRAAGLVERHPDPADARAAVIALTPAGSAAVDGLNAEGEAMIRRALADWPAPERDRLATLFARFAAEVRDVAPAPPAE